MSVDGDGDGDGDMDATVDEYASDRDMRQAASRPASTDSSRGGVYLHVAVAVNDHDDAL